MEQISLNWQDICERNHKGNLQSIAAHDSIISNKKRALEKIFGYIDSRSDGATCDEIELALNISHQTASARCSELKASGLIHSIGIRPTRSGRGAAVLRTVK